MSSGFDFTLSGIYIDTTISLFGESLLSLINIAGQINQVEVSTLVFKCGKTFNPSSLINLKLIVENRIPLFDLIIYRSLSSEAKSKVVWIVDDNRSLYNESQISFSSLFIYFMIVTRNKAIPEKNESIPNFLSKFMTIPMTIEEISNCLSENNLNLFRHTWVKSIKVSLLSQPIINRFKQGIAGMRIFQYLEIMNQIKN
jgi:hypothetical protein